jgi:hypothetical protein
VSGHPLVRTRDGVVHDPLRPDADGPTVVRTELRSGRRFRVTCEETGEDCTVDVLAAFLVAAATRPLGVLDGLVSTVGALTQPSRSRA